MRMVVVVGGGERVSASDIVRLGFSSFLASGLGPTASGNNLGKRIIIMINNSQLGIC